MIRLMVSAALLLPATLAAQDTVRFTPSVQQPTFAVREPVLRVRQSVQRAGIQADRRVGGPDPAHRGAPAAAVREEDGADREGCTVATTRQQSSRNVPAPGCPVSAARAASFCGHWPWIIGGTDGRIEMRP